MDRLQIPFLILGEFKRIHELLFQDFLMISGGIDLLNNIREI